MIALAGGAVAAATVGFLAAGAVAGRHGALNSSGPAGWPTTSGSHPSQGRSGGSSPANGGHGHGGGRAAVSPTIGLRRGVVSPVAAGFAAAMAALPRLSVAQVAGQRVIYSYSGLEPPAGLLRLISHGEAAGVIFFGDNVGSTAHLARVVAELQKADASSLNPLRGYPLLLMTDQEGGYVRRLPGAPFLSEKQVGQSADPPAAASSAGASAAATLRGVGLNVNLAPVLDVYRQPGNFIDQYGRSFSANAATVANLGQLYAGAEQRGGVAATVKHFPGLGAAAQPENTDLRPVTLSLPLATIRGTDELPYRSAIGVGVRLVMLSWAVYPALDPAHPAGLSKTIVQGELRQRLGFGGVTITDALDAHALNPFGSIGVRATLASKAGMDLLLCSGHRIRDGQSALAALEASYAHDSAAAKAAFKAAAERVIALRAILRG
jgi:beta-N-acetylhexosaminidase